MKNTTQKILLVIGTILIFIGVLRPDFSNLNLGGGSGTITKLPSTGSSGVTSITGTTNQVIASASTGAVTLSLPQDIGTTSSVRFSTLSLGTNSSADGLLKFFNSSSDAEYRIWNDDDATIPYDTLKIQRVYSQSVITNGDPYATLIQVRSPENSAVISSVNTGTDTVTTSAAHLFNTGAGVIVQNSGGAVPTGLTASTVYYINKPSSTTLKFYDTRSHSQSGGATGLVDITGSGSGTNTVYLSTQEATISLKRLRGTANEFVDFYSNGYESGYQMGIRVQKRGTGAVLRPFVIDNDDGITQNVLAYFDNINNRIGFGGNVAPATTIDLTGTFNVTGNSTFATITAGTWQGSSISTTYTDAKIKTVTGTSNRLTITGTSTDPIFDISASYVGQSSITTLGTIGTGVWQGTRVGLAYGGTNADLSATGGTGQYLKQSSIGGTVTVGTIPASDIASGAILSKTDDTNVTLTLGGSPTTALLSATSLTLGWTGTLSGTRGGTGVNNGTKTFTYLKNISFTAADDTGVYTLPTGTKTLLATDGSGASLTGITNANLSGSAGITNANLANSTISGISLGGTLGALTATNSTLTFSGSYTGASAQTVGLNLGNANTWTAKQIFQLTTNPLQIGYDGSNYLTITPDSSGNTTFALTGTSPLFAFSQGIAITGAFTVSGTGAINSTSRIFRTTNGGSNISAQIMLDISGSTTTAGALGMGFESANGQVFTAANGSRRIARAGIALGNLVNTAGSESADLIFSTERTAGAAISTSLTLTSAGNLVTTAPVRLKGYTVAGLPAGTQGDTAFVTDALAPTFGTTVTGGGAVVIPVFYNGTNWVSY